MDDNQDFPLLMVLKVSLLALTLLAICLFVFGNGRNAGDTRNVSAQSNAFVYQPRSWMDEVLPRLETMLVKATNTEMRASLTGKVNMLLYQTGLRASSSALAVYPPSRRMSVPRARRNRRRSCRRGRQVFWKTNPRHSLV